MTRYLKGFSLVNLAGEQIVKVKHGCDLMDKLNPYNAYTLFTKSGRELVIWNSHGETNLSEVKEG